MRTFYSKVKQHPVLAVLALVALILMGQSTIVRVARLNNIRNCMAPNFAGATADVIIKNCIADLPSTGGTADARGMEGNQTLALAVNFGSKTVHLRLGAATFSYAGTGGAAFVASSSSNSSIEGMGQGITVIHNTANGANADGIYPGNNMAIRHLTWQGNTTFSSGATAIDTGGDDVVIDDVEVKNYGGHGINTGGKTRWLIQNSYIHDNHDDGILLITGSSGHRVINNRVWNNGSNGIDINADQPYIYNNDVTGNGNIYAPATDCFGIYLGQTTQTISHAVISHNRVYSNACHQIIVQSASTSFDILYAQVINNQVWNSNVNAGSEGIVFDTSHPSCGNNNYGSIVGNKVDTTLGSAIVVGGGTPGVNCHVQSVHVTDNYVRLSSIWGIQVAFGNDAFISNNYSINNTSGGIDTTGATNPSLACNKTATGSVNAACAFSVPVLTNNLAPYTGGSAVIQFTSVGNTEFDWTSSAGGTRTYAALIDTSGNFYPAYDITGGGAQIKVSSAHNVDMVNSMSVGGGGVITKTFVGVATLDFPNTAAQSSADLTIAVSGVVDQDPCMVGTPGSIISINDVYTCWVSSNNTVSVRFNNYSTGAINPGSAQFKVFLIHF